MKPLSDTQLARRKKAQGVNSFATATAGLTSLGLLAASAAIRGKDGPALRLRRAAQNTSIVGAGLSGVGGLNSARIQSEQARRLSKMGERAAGRYTAAMLAGAQRIRAKDGKMVKLRRVAADAVGSLATDASPLAHAARGSLSSLAKADSDKFPAGWHARHEAPTPGVPQRSTKVKTPVPTVPRKTFDPEASRTRRQKAYTPALAGAAGASAAHAGALALRAVHNPATRSADRLAGAARTHRALSAVKGAAAGALHEQARAAASYQENMPGRSRGGQQSKIAGETRRAEKLAREAAGHRNNAELGERMAAEARTTGRAVRAAGLKRAGVAAAAAGALAGAAALNEHHRTHGGRTYNGWWEHRY